jgi:hypothetical protein
MGIEAQKGAVWIRRWRCPGSGWCAVARPGFHVHDQEGIRTRAEGVRQDRVAHASLHFPKIRGGPTGVRPSGANVPLAGGMTPPGRGVGQRREIHQSAHRHRPQEDTKASHVLILDPDMERREELVSTF